MSWGWPGVTPAAILTDPNGWRAVATLAEIGRALLVGRIPKELVRTLPGRPQQDSGLIRVKIFSSRPRGTVCADALQPTLGLAKNFA